MASNNEIMTIAEVADYLRINVKTAYRLAINRKIPCVKVGGAWRFLRHEIDNYLQDESRKNEESTKEL